MRFCVPMALRSRCFGCASQRLLLKPVFYVFPRSLSQRRPKETMKRAIVTFLNRQLMIWSSPKMQSFCFRRQGVSLQSTLRAGIFSPPCGILYGRVWRENNPWP
jgi:hypothetical protein